MSATNTDAGGGEYATLGVDADVYEGYASIELDDGELIVYDVADEAGWVQSSDWIGLEFMT